jgi:Grx4 family monothiol glutaredoxin
MVFMKGSPEAPRCGFSRQLVEILKQNEIQFASFDILADEEVRAGLKTFSDWPTYPQLYANGGLIGGLDIVKEMITLPQPLKTQLGVDNVLTIPTSTEAVPSLEARIKGLIASDEVMLFMKGGPDEPKCGFSRSLVQILRNEGIKFSHFDILTDDNVRAGLKIYSDWPTYPQLYAHNELVGGLDIVVDMVKGGPLQPQLASMKPQQHGFDHDHDHAHSSEHLHGPNCGHSH